MINEAEFRAFAAQGFNRVPMVLESFADLDTPLSLYLKLAGERYTYLLESVVGGERFGRYSFIGLAAKIRIRSRGTAIEVEDRGGIAERHEGDPIAFVAEFMDEVSLGAATMVGELKDGKVREYEVHPEDFGLSMKSNRGLKVADAMESKTMVKEALDNVEGTPREIVLLNAGAALYAANVAESIKDGIDRAREAVASGAAKRKLAQFVEATQKLATPA